MGRHAPLQVGIYGNGSKSQPKQNPNYLVPVWYQLPCLWVKIRERGVFAYIQGH